MNDIPLPPQHAVLCGPATKISEFLLDRGGPYLWTFGPDAIAKNEEDAAEYGSREWADVAEKETRELKESSAAIEVEIGNYGLSELLVLRPMQPQTRESLDPSQKRYELLANTTRFLTARAACIGVYNHRRLRPWNESKTKANPAHCNQGSRSNCRRNTGSSWKRRSRRAFRPAERMDDPDPGRARPGRTQSAIKADKSLKASPAAKTGAPTGNG